MTRETVSLLVGLAAGLRPDTEKLERRQHVVDGGACPSAPTWSIIGAGYTGLAAARQLARGGASVVVSSASVWDGAPARATAARYSPA